MNKRLESQLVNVDCRETRSTANAIDQPSRLLQGIFSATKSMPQSLRQAPGLLKDGTAKSNAQESTDHRS